MISGVPPQCLRPVIGGPAERPVGQAGEVHRTAVRRGGGYDHGKSESPEDPHPILRLSNRVGVVQLDGNDGQIGRHRHIPQVPDRPLMDPTLDSPTRYDLGHLPDPEPVHEAG